MEHAINGLRVYVCNALAIAQDGSLAVHLAAQMGEHPPLSVDLQ